MAIPKVRKWVVKYYSYEGDDITKPVRIVTVLAPTKVLAKLQAPGIMPGQWRTIQCLGLVNP